MLTGGAKQTEEAEDLSENSEPVETNTPDTGEKL